MKSLREMLTEFVGGDNHGRCTCDGCVECVGHVQDCLCDVEWQKIWELRKIATIRQRALNLHNRKLENPESD